MNPVLKEGIIFSFIIVVIFGILTVIGFSFTSQGLWLGGADFSPLVFPLSFYESWGPCQPNFECIQSMPENLALNIAIAIIIGFGISYVKNSLVKK